MPMTMPEHLLIQCEAQAIQDGMDGPGRLGISQPKPYVYTSPVTMNESHRIPYVHVLTQDLARNSA